jgi:hypothetical protein
MKGISSLPPKKEIFIIGSLSKKISQIQLQPMNNLRSILNAYKAIFLS